MSDFKTFTIKKGCHYSGFRFRPFIYKRSMSADVVFTPSCRYDGSYQLETQINKLFGFGSINHHNNSHRLGWRYSEDLDRVLIFEYFYIKGDRYENQILKVCIGQNVRLKLKYHKGYWFGKKLFPYFGGKEPAQKDLKIKIKCL